jgi:hypothetical protein
VSECGQAVGAGLALGGWRHEWRRRRRWADSYAKGRARVNRSCGGVLLLKPATPVQAAG